MIRDRCTDLMGVWCVRIGDDCGCKMGALLTVLIQGVCKDDRME